MAKALLERLRRWLGRAQASKGVAEDVRFRLIYQRFREILGINDTVLQLIADLEEKASGRVPFASEPMASRIQRATLDVFVMAKDLNHIAGGRFTGLYDALGRLNAQIDAELPRWPELPRDPLVLPIAELRASSSALAGVKMATLGEVRAALGLNVPDGFVVTTAAFSRFLSAHDLWDRVSRLSGVLEMYGPQALDTACRDVQVAIVQSPVPEEIAEAILAAHRSLGGGDEVLVAVRSSALGEDGTSSHAGQYYSELNVGHDLLLDSYAHVVASPFRPAAVSYRYQRGLPDWEAAMAVGCLKMVEPRASGIMYSRAFQDLAVDQVAISVVAGLSEDVAAGRQSAEELAVVPGGAARVQSSLLGSEDLERLAGIARRLEAHFGRPQDVEWAIDRQGTVYVLQTRAMVVAPPTSAFPVELVADREVLLAGGHTACPGVGAGKVRLVRGDADLDGFPTGGVLVARHSSAKFTQAMSRCAAIVTDVGSPSGHMASLCREFGIPTIVGLEGATRSLAAGAEVTVDATSRRVLAGALSLDPALAKPQAPLEDSPVVRKLRQVARLVAPLHLVDPSAPEFRPSACRTLHDITRFVHEKLYEVMFGFGDAARRELRHALKLACELPIQVQVFDVGGGLTAGAGRDGTVRCEEIASIPMRSFLAGLTDPRLRSTRPRPVSARGFLSVLGESMAGPPAESQGVGGASFVVLSEPYMNFSTKAGYHFSTIDTYCGRVENRNYVHLRFVGGGAAEERRIRRVRFLSLVLSQMEFTVKVHGDVLTARLLKYPQEFTAATLVRLGRLTMCVRQLDMLMDDDARVEAFAQAFLADQIERFA